MSSCNIEVCITQYNSQNLIHALCYRSQINGLIGIYKNKIIMDIFSCTYESYIIFSNKVLLMRVEVTITLFICVLFHLSEVSCQIWKLALQYTCKVIDINCISIHTCIHTHTHTHTHTQNLIGIIALIFSFHTQAS